MSGRKGESEQLGGVLGCWPGSTHHNAVLWEDGYQLHACVLGVAAGT